MKRFIDRSYLPIIILPLILFSPILFTGKALVWGTVSTQFIPWWDLAWDTLLQGNIPLWNPWVGMGAPLAANYQTAIFYPPYWSLLAIYALAGIKWMSWGVTLIVVFHLIVSGLGLAKLLKEIGLGAPAQVIGGLAFSLSGYLVARASFLSINAAAAWLPWILLYCVRLSRSQKYAFWKLGSVFALLFLAGHAQTAWYSVLMSCIWMLYWTIHNSPVGNEVKGIWKSIGKFVLAGLMGAGISAVQLIPTLEYLLQSQRAGEYGYAQAMTYSFWPWRFLTIFIPNLFGNPASGNYWGYGNYWEDALYIGLLPVLIALGAIIRAIFNKSTGRSSGKKVNLRKLVLFLTGIILISFLLALGDRTAIFPFLYRNVPTFGLFQAPTRFSLWAEMGLSMLAGIGVEQMARPAGKRTYWTRLAAAGCIAVLAGAILGSEFLPDAKSTFFLPIGLAGIIGFLTALLILFQPENEFGKRYRMWSTFMVMLVAADLLIAGWGLNPGVQSKFYEVDRSTTIDGRVFIDSDLEYDLKFSKYFKFESFSPGVPWEDMHQDMLPNLPMLSRISMVNNFDPLVPGRFQEWLEVYNRVQDPAEHQMTGMMHVGQIVTENGGKISKENILPSSEVRVNNLDKVLHDDQQILEEIIHSDADLLENMILASSPSIANANCSKNGQGEVAISRKSPGYIELESNLDNSSWVVLSRSWYPGWLAIIDGKERTAVERANFIFQAVCVPQGRHSIEIIYRPLSFTLGLIITITSLLGLFIGLVITKKRVIG